MRVEDRCDLMADLTISRHDAVTLALYVEACRAKYEYRRRALRQPEPEVIEETPLYV